MSGMYETRRGMLRRLGPVVILGALAWTAILWLVLG